MKYTKHISTTNAAIDAIAENAAAKQSGKKSRIAAPQTRLAMMLAIAMAAVLTSCLKDKADMVPNPNDGGEPVSIVLSTFTVGDSSKATTRSVESVGSPLDRQIDKMRVMIFHTTGSLAYNKVVDLTQVNNPFTINIMTGKYDFVFIANEDSDAALSSRLDTYTGTLSKLYGESFSSSAFQNAKVIPMTNIIKNVVINADSAGVGSVTVGSNTYTKPVAWPVTVERAAIRVDLFLKTDNVAAKTNFTALQLTNVPDKVYLFEKDGGGSTKYNVTGAGSFETTSPLATYRSIAKDKGDVYTVDSSVDVGYTFTDGSEQFTATPDSDGFYWWYKRIILPSSMFSDATKEDWAVKLSAVINGRPLSAPLGKDNVFTAPRNQRYKLIGTIIPDQPISFTVEVTPWGENTNVELPFKVPEIAGAGTSLSTLTYVGAFWKASEKGERVIRIAPTKGAGKWAVQVYDLGRGFNYGDILFSTEDTGSDQYLYTADPKQAESYTVTGNVFAEGTTVEENGKHYIKFRMGLKNTYSATKTAPARYAVVVIAYTPNSDGKTIYQKLFLRQGEGADYVMAPGDRQANGTAFPGGRGNAKPWSPYNLTAKEWSTDDTEFVQIKKRDFVNGGYINGTGDSEPDFAAYPTMAGAYFQWAQKLENTTWHRRAFNPGLKKYTTAGWYSTLYYTWDWDDDLHETCPDGYRRPIIMPEHKGSIDNEAWQSFVSTQTSLNGNTAWGYYADGYFDRQEVVPAVGLAANASPSMVTKGAKDAAYIGRIIFNNSPSSATHYNASLFLPAAGNRTDSTGELANAGAYGYSWSRQAFSATFGCFYVAYAGALYPYNSSGNDYKSSGFPVRCVADENWTPGGGTLKAELVAKTGAIPRDGGGTVVANGNDYTITVTSDVAFTTEVHRTTDAVTRGELSLLGKPLLRPATGLVSGPTDKVVGSPAYNGVILPFSPENYTSPFRDATGTVEFVFREASTGNVLQTLPIDIIQNPQATALPSYNYVGAFWRADQTGERLLKLCIPAGQGGEWTLAVDSYGDFAEGDIMFSLASSADSGVYGASPADMIASDATYRVTTNMTSLSGTAAANTGIAFRVGLKSKWTPTAAKPARYAKLKFTWNDGAQTPHYIYLRQGHDADYVMRNSNAEDTYGGGTQRDKAKPLSPYNLTSPIYRTDGGASSNTSDLVGYRGGVMTEYPSQSGAFFQWANTTSGARAFHPTNPNNAYADATFGTTNNVSDYWDNIEGIYETCPNGYRRPTDGPTDNNYTSTTPAVSEMAQSLWENPQNSGSTNSNIDNAIWGYYADGFFDRHKNENQTVFGGDATETSGTAVHTDKSTIACIGEVFFNKNNNASIFFPAAGYRNSSNGYLYSVGSGGCYWSASTHSATSAWYMYLGKIVAGRNDYDRSYGFPIRCVKDDAAVLVPALSTTADGASFMGDGADHAFTVTSNVAWTATIQSGTNEVTAGEMANKGYPLLVAADGFNGSAVTAPISGAAGTSPLTLTPVDYMTPNKTATGSVTIVFRNAADNSILRTITVDITQPIAMRFAKSNIVMYKDAADNRILTFAETAADHTSKTVNYKKKNGGIGSFTLDGTAAPALNANVQGLHFRWGGLVGLSSTCASTGVTNFDGTKDIQFWPAEYEAEGNIPTTAWVYDQTLTLNTGEVLVPYLGDNQITNTTDTYDAFAVKYKGDGVTSEKLGYDAATGHGDICRYISDKGWVQGKWRMPIRSELDALISETTAVDSGIRYGTPATNNWNHVAMTNPDATYTDYYGFTAVGNARMVGGGITAADAGNDDYLTKGGTARIVLPASGYRVSNLGGQTNPGAMAFYWSATPGSANNGSYLYVDGTRVATFLDMYRVYGSSVRCIRD